MNITFNELRSLKHSLPTGSIGQIARNLNLEEQTVRNYFGAKKYNDGKIISFHMEPGPEGGIVNLDDDSILLAAKKIIEHRED
jgi:hypothetical protein